MTETWDVEDYHKNRRKLGSKFEQLFVAHWRLHKSDGLPDPEREQCLIEGRDWRCDFVWRDIRLVVEVDGGQWKSGGGRHNTDDDRDKINKLTLAGWKVLRYSGTKVKSDPMGVIKEVSEAVLRFKK
jgi:very-short-patch-repair endonuclease